MADTTGICYTWSGDKKKYESDLFKAQLYIFGSETCDRYDSIGSYTLVFGKPSEIGDGPEFSTYLPYGDISINHNIQANGEDHYTYSGTYTRPQNWSPPPGLDGPFDYPNGLKYPYYVDIITWAGSIYTFYNGKLKTFDLGLFSYMRYYGNKEDITPPADTHHEFIVRLDISSNHPGTIRCQCNGYDWIPGTDFGNVTLALSGRMYYNDDDRDNDEWFDFSWLMKDGIDESKPCRHIWPCNMALGFDTQSSWEIDNGDGSKTYYDFEIR